MTPVAATQWDGASGPYTWHEFATYYRAQPGEARRRWVQGALQLRLDGADGPYSWAEFVAYYGSPQVAAHHWRRGIPCAQVVADSADLLYSRA